MAQWVPYLIRQICFNLNYAFPRANVIDLVISRTVIGIYDSVPAMQITLIRLRLAFPNVLLINKCLMSLILCLF